MPRFKPLDIVLVIIDSRKRCCLDSQQDPSNVLVLDCLARLSTAGSSKEVSLTNLNLVVRGVYRHLDNIWLTEVIPCDHDAFLHSGETAFNVKSEFFALALAKAMLFFNV
jgi:hypothetical protein